jgi:protein SCO1/2
MPTTGINGLAVVRLARIRRVLWVLAGAAAAAFAATTLWLENTGVREDAAFSASFELVDHHGAVRTERDFAGQWLLIFFGFANCPDVCPTTLSDVSYVMDEIGDRAQSVQPLFISIDPERDTPDALAGFVPLFDAGIVGLTGTPAQIQRTAQTFHIFYDRAEDASAPDGYTMAHSSQLFLFDPDAQYVRSWSYGTAAERIAAELEAIVR